jgi:hypothetical protein
MEIWLPEPADQIGITLHKKGMEESGIPIIGTELKQSRKNIIKDGAIY